jgi:hypothetical protein
MKKIAIFILLISFLCLLVGCNTAKDLDAAKQLGQEYFEIIQSKNFNKATEFYSPQFFEKTSQSDILQMLQGVNMKLGDLQSFSCTNWYVNSYAGTGGSYTRYTLEYDTVYSKGTAKETLNIIKSKDSSKMQILGYNINSLDLIKN